jgi:hypothetical protein
MSRFVAPPRTSYNDRLSSALMILLSLVFLLPVGGLILWAGRRRGFGHVWAAGLGLIGLTMLVWLVAGASLDRPVTLLNNSYQSAGLPPWTWELNATSWLLTGLWLLLGGLLLLYHWRQPAVLAGTLALLGAGLSFTAAGNATTLLAGLLLASGVWLAVGYSGEPEASGQVLAQRLIFWWLAIGLASYLLLPTSEPQGFMLGLAALPLAGLFPFQQWRANNWPARTRLAPLLYGLPLLAALKLFTIQPDLTVTTGADWLAPWGVVALALALAAAWAKRDGPAGRVALLSAGGVLVWLAGTFGGAGAALAEGRGVLLAGVALFVLPHLRARALWQRLPHWLLAATLVGLPLTAGGFGRGLLYNGLAAQGQMMALLLISLLTVPLTALWLSWAIGEPTTIPALHDTGNGPLRPILPWLFLLLALPLPAQISGLGELTLNSWLALVLPLISGAVLVYVRQQRPGFSWNPEQLGRGRQTLLAQLNQLGLMLRQAIAEAGRLLEGEGGLLWILCLAVLFGLARL